MQQEFEPGNDREHCRLDLHRIMDAPRGGRASAMREWFAKWGRKVDWLLTAVLSGDDEDSGSIAQAEAEAADSEKSLDEAKGLVNAAIDALELEPPDVETALAKLEEIE